MNPNKLPKAKTTKPKVRPKSLVTRRQEAFERGDEKAIEELTREIFEEWHGIPKKIKTRADVQKYFQYLRKWLLEGEETLVRAIQDEHFSFPKENFEKEFSDILLSYWSGKLPHFNALVRMDELKAEADLLDSKEYRAVKGIIEEKIQLCSEDLAKQNAKTPTIVPSGSLWLGTDSQLVRLSQWLTEKGLIEAQSTQTFLDLARGKVGAKVVWRDTATLLSQLFQLIGSSHPMLIRDWAKTAGKLFCGVEGKPLKFLSAKAKKAGDAKEKAASRWHSIREEVLEVIKE